MRYVVVFFHFAIVVPCVASAQNNNQRGNSNTTDAAQSGKIKICQGLPIPEGYMIVAFQPHPACPQAAYVVQNEKLVAGPQFPAVKGNRISSAQS